MDVLRLKTKDRKRENCEFEGGHRLVYIQRREIRFVIKIGQTRGRGKSWKEMELI